MQDKRRIHYVLSTHWDREWYQSFQDFRYRLVKLMDRIIHGLQDGQLRGPFQTDGQAILLEDYLEIRPERQSVIEQFLKEGKLVAGPWYVLPDEFTVSGEALIRNLRLGRELVREWGGQPSNAGFLCDMFGHISQMPQIMAGFGIPAAFIWRGTNLIEQRLVRWIGSDGTELPCVRFGEVGYCSYAYRIRRANVPDWHMVDEESLADDLEQYADEEARMTETEALLFFDGGDHQDWDTDIYQVFSKWMNWEGQRYDVQHTSLDAFLEEMIQQKGKITMELQGELREPGKYPLPVDQQWIIPGVLSSRVNLKQANHRCQTLLCQWAEPLTAFNHYLTGEETPPGYLQTAWRWLLQNHPHDSIDGCSIDQVHHDMQYRFDQCLQISERLLEESSKTICANISGQIGENEVRVTVFNPLPHPYQGITEIDLRLPPDWPTFNEFFGFEPKPAFRIFAATGEEIPYQRLAQKGTQNQIRPLKAKFWHAIPANIVSVALPIFIPAKGYTTFTIRPGEAGIPTRYPEVPGLVNSDRSLENDLLRVEINPNGTLRLIDKRSGEKYENLLTFEDIADIGDGWYHGQAANDQAFYSSGCHADIACLSNGPELGRFLVRVYMPVPEEFLFDKMIRSERRAQLVIDNILTLRKDQDYLEVTTSLNNVAGDHRLRVLLPSNIKVNSYLSDSAFDVIERPVALRKDNYLFRELEVETRPQQSWTAVFDENHGIAIISDGLLESAVRDIPERPIALTLFRSTRRTVMTNGEPGGQLLGPLSFRYFLLPVQGNPDRARLASLGQFLAAGLHDVQLTNKDQPFHQQNAHLPPSAGMFEIKGNAVVTSARVIKDGFEIRMFNPMTERIKCELTFEPYPLKQLPWTKYCLVNLESQRQSNLQTFTDRIQLEFDPKKILTILLVRDL